MSSKTLGVDDRRKARLVMLVTGAAVVIVLALAALTRAALAAGATTAATRPALALAAGKATPELGCAWQMAAPVQLTGSYWTMASRREAGMGAAMPCYDTYTDRPRQMAAPSGAAAVELDKDSFEYMARFYYLTAEPRMENTSATSGGVGYAFFIEHYWPMTAEREVARLALPLYSSWEPALSLEAVPGTSSELNTPFLDGCPILSRDGRYLYLASDRPGGLGGLDIWVAERSGPGAPFGAPVNMGAPVNSASNDFCPSPLGDGQGFMFVSNRPGGCGGADIYLTRRHPELGWEAPANLGCQVNSSADEAGPVLSNTEPGPPTLYFSSTRAGGQDLYLSRKAEDWSLGPAELVPGVNSAYDDMQPDVRRDGRELVFASNRPGSLGGFDIWSASRDAIAASWSQPVNLGPNVNSAANETRPSLSWDANTLLFGTNRPGVEGVSDIFYATRE